MVPRPRRQPLAPCVSCALAPVMNMQVVVFVSHLASSHLLRARIRAGSPAVRPRPKAPRAKEKGSGLLTAVRAANPRVSRPREEERASLPSCRTAPVGHRRAALPRPVCSFASTSTTRTGRAVLVRTAGSRTSARSSTPRGCHAWRPMRCSIIRDSSWVLPRGLSGRLRCLCSPPQF